MKFKFKNYVFMPQLDAWSFFQIASFIALTYILFYSFIDASGRYFFFGTSAITLNLTTILKQAIKIKKVIKNINNATTFEDIGVRVK